MGGGRWRWVVLATPVLLVAAALSIGATPGLVRETRPPLPHIGTAQVVDTTDVADPFVLPVTPPSGRSTVYYRFGTTDWQSNVPTATSTDLVTWRASPDAFPILPVWAADSISMTWAPAVVAVDGQYLLYVTTEEASTRRQCISLATSAGPQGPYSDTSKQPFLCQHDLGGSIDPSVVREAGGRLHLLWKNDGNCCGLPTSLWEQDLSKDGRHLVGAAHTLLSAQDPWQHGNIEGPAMIAATGHGWWLFYSGGSWRTNDYATGIAYCPTVHGPCGEVLHRPFLAGTPEMRTPGGLETFRDGRGKARVAFTTTVRIESKRRPGHFFMNRVLDVAPLLPG